MLHSTHKLGISFAILGLGLQAWGQQLKPHKFMDWPDVAAQYPCSRNTVSVELMGAESDKWMLAVEANQTGGSIVAQAAVHEPYAAMQQGRNLYTAVPGILAGAGPCRFVLNTGLATGRRALLHLQVATGTTTLEVLRSGRTETRMVVGSGVLLSERGVVTLEGGRHLLQGYALYFSVSPQTDDLMRDAHGRFFVTSLGWKSHIVRTRNLPIASESGSRCCTTPPDIVFVHCTINEQGLMQSLKIVDATPDLESRLSGLLKETTFKPFEFQGKTVVASGIIPVLVSQDGSLFLSF